MDKASMHLPLILLLTFAISGLAANRTYPNEISVTAATPHDCRASAKTTPWTTTTRCPPNNSPSLLDGDHGANEPFASTKSTPIPGATRLLGSGLMGLIELRKRLR